MIFEKRLTPVPQVLVQDDQPFQGAQEESMAEEVSTFVLKVHLLTANMLVAEA